MMDEILRTNIGGYRVVRKIGEGAAAEVFLGYPVEDGASASPVALKIYRPQVSQSVVLRESEALSRAAGDHVVRLRDVIIGPENALVLDRMPRAALSRLLTERAWLHYGEAITILVPLLEEIVRFHHAGCVHGAIAADRVLFTSDGAPVLVGFGAATLVAPNLSVPLLFEEQRVIEDLRLAAVLVTAVLQRVDDERAHDLADWATATAASHPEGWCGQLIARLFDLGDPRPIDFDAEAGVDARRATRVLATTPPVDGSESMPLRAAGLPEWIVSTIAPLRERSANWRAQVRSILRPMRRRTWLLAGIGALLFSGALLLLPAGAGGTQDQAGVGPQTSDSTAEPVSASKQDAASAIIVGDDPIRAAVVLIEARTECFRTLSVICLDAVTQQDSSAWVFDSTAILDAQNGAEIQEPWSVLADQLILIERDGDAALLEWATSEKSEPASLLLMKGEAGWRIRNYIPRD